MKKQITFGDGGEKIDPKIPEEGEGCDSLEPKSSAVKEEEVPFCFFSSILFLPLYKPLYENQYFKSELFRVFLYKDNPRKIHQSPPEKMRKLNCVFIL